MEFDPYDEDCWYFGSITREAIEEVLMNRRQEVGVFIIRDSKTQPGDFVLCVREEFKIRHYLIYTRKRDANSKIYIIGDHEFWDIPALLTYYHANDLDATSSLKLKRPACKRIPNSRPLSLDSMDSSRSSFGSAMVLPAFACVIADRIPNGYDQTALTLHEGDMVKVTKINMDGMAEGVFKGKFGKFPFTLLEFEEPQ